MIPTNRCDQILRLIDDVLRENETGGATQGPPVHLRALRGDRRCPSDIDVHGGDPWRADRVTA